MGVSRYMWERGLRSDFAKLREHAVDERDQKVKEVSMKWKEGYKVLKEENDRMQRELNEWYKNEMASIDADLKRLLAAGPPKN